MNNHIGGEWSVEPKHDCDVPYVERDDIKRATWRCPVCGQRYVWTPQYGDWGSLTYEAVGRPSWRWRRREARRIAVSLSNALEQHIPEPVIQEMER